MHVLAVTTGRADATPLAPVILALESRGCAVEHWDWSGWVFDAPPVFWKDTDLVLILGDRYEALAAALNATMEKVPIAHIHGGEVTRGSFDNQIRNAITKLAHIHFTATERATKRVRDLDEKNVFHVGAPGLDNIVDLPPRERTKTFVLTYHPETLGKNDAKAITEALVLFPNYEVIWTGVNNDPGASEIKNHFSIFYKEHHLTPEQYRAACHRAAAVIGNSSSGIIECPTLEVPTVNIGRRQEGRECGPAVFTCGADAIVETIRKALDYRGPFTNPYGGPGASKKIANILMSIDLKDMLIK